MSSSSSAEPRSPSSRAGIVIAARRGDVPTLLSQIGHPDAAIRGSVVRGLQLNGALTGAALASLQHDSAAAVRRTVAEMGADNDDVDLLGLLADTDATVVEAAAWAAGERASPDLVLPLVDLATGGQDKLVRESAVAALGAIGDRRGLAAILAAMADIATVRRRAVLALAPFVGEDVDAALDAASTDRDWQVRQAAEDLRRAGSGGEH